MNLPSVAAFLSPDRAVPTRPPCPSCSGRAVPLATAAVGYDELLARVDHYAVEVAKPMGVIFGENPAPFRGLVVDDVGEGLNGGRAGLRVGDQLLAVGERVVVGREFGSVMDRLQDGPSTLSLVMYRGPVEQLFAVLDDQLDEDEVLYDDGDDDGGDLDAQPVVMDDNYEAPLLVDVEEEEAPLDYAMGFRKLGGMVLETLTGPVDGATDSDAPPPPKKKTGFFGIGGETVQLEGGEADGTR